MGKFFEGSAGSSTTESKPWAPAVPHLEKILGEMGGWYDNAKGEGYISQTGDLNAVYGDYLNKLQQANQSTQENTQAAWDKGLAGLEGTSAFYDKLMSGGSDITSSDITGMANDFIDNDLLQGQIDAANQDTVRNFNENTIPGIDRSAVEGGNLGSSRGGVAAAVAERSANEQMATTSANMRGNAYNNALTQAQSVLGGNITNQMAGAQGAGNNANSWFNASNGTAQNVMGGLSGNLTAAQMQSMLQGSAQADKIGNQNFLANLLGQYSNIATGIGGMGGTQTTTQKNPGTSMFDKLLQVADTASKFAGGKP